MGGVFGFFLGVTMLKCLQRTWAYALRSKHALHRGVSSQFAPVVKKSFTRRMGIARSKNKKKFESKGTTYESFHHHLGNINEKNARKENFEIYVHSADPPPYNTVNY